VAAIDPRILTTYYLSNDFGLVESFPFYYSGDYNHTLSRSQYKQFLDGLRNSIKFIDGQASLFHKGSLYVSIDQVSESELQQMKTYNSMIIANDEQVLVNKYIFLNAHH